MLAKQSMSDNFITKTSLLDNKYYLQAMLGEGGTADVFSAVKKNNESDIFAIKIFKNDKEKYFQRETQMHLRVNGEENVTKLIDGNPGAQLIQDKGERKVSYLCLELASKGELFDYIFYYNKQGFGEDFSRYIFKEYLQGLKNIHKSGIVHRDLKADNVLITGNFTFKISDFGFANQINGENIGILLSKKGTPEYAAPEMWFQGPYYGLPVDIFSSGVFLFFLVFGLFPFKNTKLEDDRYKLIRAEYFEEFWKPYMYRYSCSVELIQLINLMFAYDPVERPSINEILNHPWMLLPTPSKEKVVEEFTKREKVIEQEKKREAGEKEAERMKVEVKEAERMIRKAKMKKQPIRVKKYIFT